MISDLEFHHLGVATRSIEREERTYAGLGYAREGASFEDPIQGVRGVFLTGPGPRLELLEALPGSDVLAPWLAAGVHIYHQAFLTTDLDRALETVLAQRARCVRTPVPSVAFGGKRIAFVMLPNMALVELVER